MGSAMHGGSVVRALRRGARALHGAVDEAATRARHQHHLVGVEVVGDSERHPCKVSTRCSLTETTLAFIATLLGGLGLLPHSRRRRGRHRDATSSSLGSVLLALGSSSASSSSSTSTHR